MASIQHPLQRGYAPLAPGSHHWWPVPLLPASTSLTTRDISGVAKRARTVWEERLHEAVLWAESQGANITDFRPEPNSTSNDTHKDGYLEPFFTRNQTNPTSSIFRGQSEQKWRRINPAVSRGTQTSTASVSATASTCNGSQPS